MKRSRTSVHLHVEELEDRLALANAPLSAVPVLHSFPGAPVAVYLDFNGHFERRWGQHLNVTNPAFDMDGDEGSFSTQELDRITEIWKQVAEDFAPFNLDVTTVEPSYVGDRIAVRVAIGGNGSWYSSVGGVAGSAGAFTDPFVSNTVYVFSRNVGLGAVNVAMVASHETGHTFGLDHQSRWAGGVQTEYHPGSGDWGPIMGSPYSRQIRTWHNGTTSSPGTFQDDMAIIASGANGFGYRADDHGDADAVATDIAGGTLVSATGIVGTMTDVDVFRFGTNGGTISATVQGIGAGQNLDAVLELYDATGRLLASDDPTASLDASLTMTVPAGAYFLHVRATGTYGRVGQYTLDVDTASTIGPTVLRHTPAGTTAPPASFVDLTFSEDMVQASFDPVADVSRFIGPGGVDLRARITGHTWLNNRALRITFETQAAEGAYLIEIGSGLTALATGLPMDGDRNAVGGTATDGYIARFTLRVPPPPGPRPAGIDVTPLVLITRGGLRFNPRKRFYVQKVRIENWSTETLWGSFALVLPRLPRRIKLKLARGEQRVPALSGTAVKVIPLDRLEPDQVVTITLRFVNRSRRSIRYGLQLLSQAAVAAV